MNIVPASYDGKRSVMISVTAESTPVLVNRERRYTPQEHGSGV